MFIYGCYGVCGVLWSLKSPKKIGDKILAIFRSKKGGLGGARFRPSSSVVVRRVPKTRVFRIAKKSQVAKKNETADDGGGSVRRAQRPATPAHAQAHAANCQIWHSEKW